MKRTFDPRTDPDVPPGMSIELLKDLHLLTRDGHLNADARRKLKQIRHFVGLLKPATDDLLARYAEPTLVDCGAGKSYLGFLLAELVLAKAGKGTLYAIESRPELTAQGASRAARFGHDRLRFVDGTIEAAGLPAHAHLVVALHACDTATDEAIVLGLTHNADHIAVVPCCQAEVARQLATGAKPNRFRALFDHNLHRREFGSHVTNVIRALTLQALGYAVSVTELVGWEHSAKNELIIARRIGTHHHGARGQLADLLSELGVEPALIRLLRERGRSPV